MIKLTTNKRKIEGPTSWDEVTVEKFQDVFNKWNKVDDLQLKSILYGLDYDELANSTDHYLIPVLEQASSFWTTTQLKNEVPDVLIIDGKSVFVPKIVKAYSVGQAIMARRTMEGKSYNECIARIVAIYLQPEWSGTKINEEQIDKLEQIILTMPLPEVFGIGFFLLQSVEKLWESFRQLMDSVKIPGADKDEETAAIAGVHQLAPLADLIMINKYATTYMMDPDEVFDKTPFDTVQNMMYTWKQQEAFNKRFDNIKKLLPA